jgi:hypothetical protein
LGFVRFASVKVKDLARGSIIQLGENLPRRDVISLDRDPKLVEGKVHAIATPRFIATGAKV